MKYELFLFDADDTLFDFKSCERSALSLTMKQYGFDGDIEDFYQTYIEESAALWRELESGMVSKDFLKAERFGRTFLKHKIALSPEAVGETYLELLPECSVLIESALELCRFLAEHGRIGIITNGYEKVQRRRLADSPLSPFVEFMVISETCGFVKPDVRFFEYAAKIAGHVDKDSILVVGDRLETDIAGARAFGVDACWFNPHRQPSPRVRPRFEISHLSELRSIVEREIHA